MVVIDSGSGSAPEEPIASPEPAAADQLGEPFDVASLPSLDTIIAGSDVRAFLQKGVPAAMTRAALRRAWSSDPAIRDFIEMAENQWDFASPGSIPGFGPLGANDDVRQLVAKALGELQAERDPPAEAGPAHCGETRSPTSSTPGLTDCDPSEASDAHDASSAAIAESAPQQNPSDAVEEPLPLKRMRRTHGRALPT
jgi:hypothetical protein